MSLSENDLWLLSFYRHSEITGALFFGRVAQFVRGPLQVDVTHHFSDEANHANYWTKCINELGELPLRQRRAYQDQYIDAVGVPVNVMEVMAITQVFEKRVIAQYNQHMRIPGIHPAVRQTLEKIMLDERWHVKYVRNALKAMEERYGAEEIEQTLKRHTEADNEVYAKALAEYGERFDFLNSSVSQYSRDG
ncbi:ferritin-like domain-containing protein [Mycobacterium marinum]|uniref:ferritin-like domain-containing protein n=1 Tax=Mycobacterium marinum TaxID=1781 RepID=UPI0035679B45